MAAADHRRPIVLFPFNFSKRLSSLSLIQKERNSKKMKASQFEEGKKERGNETFYISKIISMEQEEKKGNERKIHVMKRLKK